MQPMKTPDGKTYTDYHAYINALARLSGLTYGQYVARYDAPATAPKPPRSQPQPAPGESARCAFCGRVFITETGNKKYCSKQCRNKAQHMRTGHRRAPRPKKDEKEEHIESLHLPRLRRRILLSRIAGIGETELP